MRRPLGSLIISGFAATVVLLIMACTSPNVASGAASSPGPGNLTIDISNMINAGYIVSIQINWNFLINKCNFMVLGVGSK